MVNFVWMYLLLKLFLFFRQLDLNRIKRFLCDTVSFTFMRDFAFLKNYAHGYLLRFEEKSPTFRVLQHARCPRVTVKFKVKQKKLYFPTVALRRT